MEENKTNDQMDADLQELIIEDAPVQEDNKKRLKKRIFNLIYDVLILVGIGCLVYGGYSMYETYRDSKEAEQSYEELKNEFVKPPVLPSIPNYPSGSEGTDNTEGADNTEGTDPSVGTQVPERPREWYEQIWVDLKGMQTKINPDIVGWIHFENEDISYPLLYSEDNAEYQRVRYDQVYSNGGSIFLEASNTWNLSDIRNVIYGHNMKDGSMFGKLKRYNQIKGYYEDHQYFQLIYDGMVYRYQIFSYFTIHETEVHYINTNFKAGSEVYGNFLKKLMNNSIKDTNIEVDANDKTVTLVTCAPDNKYRFIVNAVLVDQHTMANADGTYPDEPGTEEPGTEPDTQAPDDEPDTNAPDVEPDEPVINPDDPGTEPGERPGGDEYTYTPVGKNMMAKVSVKIRNKPSTDGVRISYLPRHETVYVEAVCNETGWYRVRYGNKGRNTGYISGKYLTEENLHVYTSAETLAPTCTESGVMTHTCDCGHSYTTPIEPRHTEVVGGTADVHSKCGVCEVVISAEHVLVETTTETGAVVYVCECGYVTDTPPETEVPTETPSEEPSEPETPSEEPSEPETPSEEPSEPETSSEEPSEPETPGEEPNEPETPSEESSEPTQSE